MNIISVRVRTKNKDIDKVWSILTDIKSYPKRVKFVKKVDIYGKSAGSKWDDTTTILWVPMKMKHTVIAFQKNKEYSFEIPLYFGGKMKQEYKLIKEGSQGVVIKGIVSYTLGNRFLNKTIGVLLNRRLRNMLLSSVQFVEGEVF